MKKIFVGSLFCLISYFSVAQTISYYPFNSVLSVSSNPQNKIWFDGRLQTNSYFSALSTEIAPMFNINSNPKARLYAGIGFRFNFVNVIADYRAEALEGYALNVGVRSAPIEKAPNLQFIFELSPYVQKGFDIGQFRSQIGVGYSLGSGGRKNTSKSGYNPSKNF